MASVTCDARAAQRVRLLRIQREVAVVPLRRSLLCLTLAAGALAAAASGLRAQDGDGPPRWHLASVLAVQSNFLLGPSLRYDAFATSRTQVALTTSALWATDRIRPFDPACDQPMHRPICSNAPAASRLISVGLEGRLSVLEDLYLIAALSGVEGWWARPVVGRHRSAQAALGLGLAMPGQRTAAELRAQTEGSTGRQVFGALFLLRFSR